MNKIDVQQRRKNTLISGHGKMEHLAYTVCSGTKLDLRFSVPLEMKFGAASGLCCG
ncbi:MAG: hypothetical protein AAF483_02580 [Planctomycetota bacterium]